MARRVVAEGREWRGLAAASTQLASSPSAREAPLPAGALRAGLTRWLARAEGYPCRHGRGRLGLHEGPGTSCKRIDLRLRKD